MSQELVTITKSISIIVNHRDRKAVVVQLPNYAQKDASFIQLWLRNQRAYKTVRAYAATISRFSAFVGKSLPELTLADLQNFAESLYELSPASQASMLAAVKSCLTFCAQAGYLSANVGVALKLPRPEEQLARRILSEAQVAKMLALEANKRNHALLILLYGAGLRVSEICALKRRDLQENGEAGQVTVYGKRGKTRSVLLQKSVWEELMALCGHADPETYVFQSRQTVATGGTPTNRKLDASQVTRIVKAAAVRAEIHVYTTEQMKRSSHVSAHWLRHAHASHALQRNAPAPLVRDTLGHDSLETTNKYAHARPNESSSLYLPL